MANPPLARRPIHFLQEVADGWELTTWRAPAGIWQNLGEATFPTLEDARRYASGSSLFTGAIIAIDPVPLGMSRA